MFLLYLINWKYGGRMTHMEVMQINVYNGHYSPYLDIPALKPHHPTHTKNNQNKFDKLLFLL